MKQNISIFLTAFGVAVLGMTQAEEHSYGTVMEKWESPTPWLKDRFTDFLENMPKNAVVAEIGVEGGGFSAFILSATHPKELYLIDCWEHQDPAVYIDPDNVSSDRQESLYHSVRRRFAHQNQVKIIRKYSCQAVGEFPDEFFDWVYIDANHGYETAKLDIAMWWPKVKKGGYLAGHDYIIRPYFGVVQALNEFMLEKNLYFSFLTVEEGKHDSWAIQKPY